MMLKVDPRFHAITLLGVKIIFIVNYFFADIGVSSGEDWTRIVPPQVRRDGLPRGKNTVRISNVGQRVRVKSEVVRSSLVFFVFEFVTIRVDRMRAALQVFLVTSLEPLSLETFQILASLLPQYLHRADLFLSSYTNQPSGAADSRHPRKDDRDASPFTVLI